MSTHNTFLPLCRIDECSDLMVDACLCDPQLNLLFLSAWGRDTAVQEFLARLTLGREQNGLEQFTLLTPDQASLTVFPGNISRLQKRTTRAFTHTYFGSLVNLWLFDERCVAPDKANARSIAVLRKDTADLTDRLWALAQETCPLPLLSHWRDPVMELLKDTGMLTPVPYTIGALSGFQLNLDVPALSAALGELIRSDRIGLLPHDLPTQLQLPKAA